MVLHSREASTLTIIVNATTINILSLLLRVNINRYNQKILNLSLLFYYTPHIICSNHTRLSLSCILKMLTGASFYFT